MTDHLADHDEALAAVARLAIDEDTQAATAGLAEIATEALAALARIAIESEDPAAVGRVLVGLDAIRDRLVGKRGESVGHVGEVEAHLLACFDGRAISGVVVGSWKLGRRYSTPRKAWKWDDLLREVVVRAKADATGELEAPEWTVARAIKDCIGFSSGKVTGLRKMGLDPDEFCETGTAVVQVERVKVETPEPF